MSHPAWAEELRRRYLRGEASQFVLHGNVFDLVEHDGQLLPVQEYLTERLLSENKDIVVVFNVATGGRLLRRKADLGGLDDLLLQRERTKFMPAMERVLKTAQKVALIIEYAETVAPAADPALMSDDDRSSVVTLHRWSMAPEIEASDSVVLLLAENLSELHPKLVSNPKIATVRVPMPDEETRLRVIATCQPKAEPAYAKRLAAITAGLRAVQIQAILQPPPPAAAGDEEERAKLLESLLGAGAKDVKNRARQLATLTRGMAPDQVKALFAPDAPPPGAAGSDEAAQQRARAERDEVARVIARRKREIIERECFGLIEFVEPGHDFRVVGGIEGVKIELQRIAAAIRDGNTARVPMGLLFTGPMGAGKTFVAEAFAKESGLTAIKLKNFRSKWVGATEGNLERILAVVQAIGQVLVIIDEGDRAFGSGGDGGEGDGGTSSRVIGRIKEFMSDTSNRGRILFILMTNRPDKLDVDIKRAGRLDKKIPLLYAQTPDEVEAVLLAQLRKHRLENGLAFPADRAAVSQPILGMSNADFEAIVLLAAEIASGPNPAATTIRLERDHLVQAIADYLPSRDQKMLEYMELLAVFEASNRKMLPKKYETMSAEELQARLEILRLECGNRR